MHMAMAQLASPDHGPKRGAPNASRCVVVWARPFSARISALKPRHARTGTWNMEHALSPYLYWLLPLDPIGTAM
jgi:hypothetical protein